LAYDLAEEGISGAGSTYGLLDYYYDVHLGSNDRNKEILLYADHSESSPYYNGAVITGSAGGTAPENYSPWFPLCNYADARGSSSATEWVSFNGPLHREAAQAYSRPWSRMAPVQEVFTKTFADKTNDSRYDGTFTTVFRANFDKGGVTAPVYNANLIQIQPGDAVFSFLDEEPATPLEYPGAAGRSNIGAAELPGRSDFVIAPSGISRIYYPNLWKTGCYRTDNGTGLGQPNAGHTRPANIAKFSEFYLIAAEAAVKLNRNEDARRNINVLRARAGKWRWHNNGNVAKDEDHSAAMIAATPAQITIKYVLEERSRELFGEGYRWHDLIRTQMWNEIAATYHIGGTAASNDLHSAAEFRRTIEPGHYLQPIPQAQIDGLETTESEKREYQNPFYRTN
jgi:hypothetical protein